MFDYYSVTKLTGRIILHHFAAVIGLALAAPLASAQTIDTVAGTGLASNNGDQGSALEINVSQPFGVEIGPGGGLYVTEVGHHRIFRVDLVSGRIQVVAGNGRKGYAGDGGLATAAELNEPYEVRFDAEGHMYFVEMQNHVVRRVDRKTGRIVTIAGTGRPGFSGDGGPATKATFNRPHSIALDGRGGLFIADIGNHRIRRVDLESGKVETIAGSEKPMLPRDGQVAQGNPILGPRALFVQGRDLWIALREGHSVWRLDLTSGTLHHVAGTGKKGYSGDGGPALKGTFKGPKGIAVDSQGGVFVVDTENQAIRKIDTKTGMLSTVAGRGPKGRGGAGDGGPATAAEMGRPHGVCIGPGGAVFIGDTLNHRVRRVK